jgi:endonuclease/exonuclease/phosphatase family metal-dependent hydrolase
MMGNNTSSTSTSTSKSKSTSTAEKPSFIQLKTNQHQTIEKVKSTLIFPLYFDHSNNCWQKIQKQNVDSTSIKNDDVLKIMSFNVWFDRFERERRFDALLNLIEDHQCDVVCLQEMTVETLLQLEQSPFIRQNYFSSGNTWGFNWYGIVVIWRKQTFGVGLSLQSLNLPTGQGRTALLLKLQIRQDKSLMIGTVHLESLDNRVKRKQQLGIMTAVANDCDNVLLMGDFNFDSETNYFTEPKHLPLENRTLSEVANDYSDLWSTLNKDKKPIDGITFDNQGNSMFPRRDQVEQAR